jgi:hypothetical protein
MERAITIKPTKELVSISPNMATILAAKTYSYMVSSAATAVGAFP